MDYEQMGHWHEEILRKYFEKAHLQGIVWEMYNILLNESIYLQKGSPCIYVFIYTYIG